LKPQRPRHKGVFITLEGIEGSGKSTQGQRLAERLQAAGLEVIRTREPGGTALAEDIRRILLNVEGERLLAVAEALLIFAARSQHVNHVILPGLRRGALVLCDRFADSTLAYQGFGRGLSVPQLRQLNRMATQGLVPDLTLLFDLPVREGLARRWRVLEGQNRLDRESQRFHQRVRRGFLTLAKNEPRRFRRIDASRAPDQVANQVLSEVEQCLKRLRVRPVAAWTARTRPE
jgi:dTMP kinase